MSLESGSVEALQALLHSIAPAEEANKVSPEALQRLSAGLKNLLGDEGSNAFLQTGNKIKNVPVNEDGLPIVDITEPAPDTNDNEDEGMIPPDPDLIPLSSLPPGWKAEQERLLALLEEEEEEEEERRRAKEVEMRREENRKRSAGAQMEVKRLKALKDMQRRMGKALVDANEKTKPPPPPPTSKASDSGKKTVTFAEETKEEDPTPKPSLIHASRLDDTLPMRMNVVERTPPPPSSSSSSKIQLNSGQPDSDDESDIEPPLSEDDEDIGELELEEDDLDLDEAEHQREIAREYYKQRSTIVGSSPLHDSNPPTVEHVDGAYAEKTKPPISQFRASRLAEHFQTSPTHSHTILPAQTLQKSIRLGKLDFQGRLVGEEDSSDEEMQEILELLRKGEVHNAGPDGPHSFVPPKVEQVVREPLRKREGTSRFKAARSGAGLSSDRQPVERKEQVVEKTPAAPTVVERKPPAVVERNPPAVVERKPPSVVERKPPTVTAPPVIIDSPSFPQAPPSSRPSRPPTVMTTSVSERTTPRVPAPTREEGKKVSRFMSARMDEDSE